MAYSPRILCKGWFGTPACGRVLAPSTSYCSSLGGLRKVRKSIASITPIWPSKIWTCTKRQFYVKQAWYWMVMFEFLKTLAMGLRCRWELWTRIFDSPTTWHASQNQFCETSPKKAQSRQQLKTEIVASWFWFPGILWVEDKNIFADTDTFWDMIGSAKVYSQTLEIISRATDLPVAAPLVGC